MLELIKAGGFLMWPIMFCSVISMGIIAERAWSLRKTKIVPHDLVNKIWEWQKTDNLNNDNIKNLRSNSPLGEVLAAGLINKDNSREAMKESIENAGRHVSHQLARFLNTLGTISSISPLLGLLGTVIGMIKTFTVITVHGVGNPEILSEGISEALITTATGLSVAIPSLMFYRYFRGRVDDLIITMEQESLKVVDIIHGISEK